MIEGPNPPGRSGKTPAGDLPPSDKLKAERVELMLKSMPEWKVEAEQQALVRVFEFRSHAVATSFVHWVFTLSERRSQFPEVRLQQSRVALTLSTPKLKGVTLRDIDFARIISQRAAIEEKMTVGSRGGQPTTSPSRKEVVLP
jgi:pterin-4a-carbinolamine dehydratase